MSQENKKQTSNPVTMESLYLKFMEIEKGSENWDWAISSNEYKNVYVNFINSVPINVWENMSTNKIVKVINDLNISLEDISDEEWHSLPYSFLIKYVQNFYVTNVQKGKIIVSKKKD